MRVNAKGIFFSALGHYFAKDNN